MAFVDDDVMRRILFSDDAVKTFNYENKNVIKLVKSFERTEMTSKLLTSFATPDNQIQCGRRPMPRTIPSRTDIKTLDEFRYPR